MKKCGIWLYVDEELFFDVLGGGGGRDCKEGVLCNTLGQDRFYFRV